jgi:DNA-binding Lrp family transcriptional regulator
MVTAIVLIHARRDRIPETTQALLKLDGVREVYSVAGEWDIAAMIRVRENEQLADLVTHQMLKLEGIEKTTTLIAFATYSNYDLDRLFSIGADGP